MKLILQFRKGSNKSSTLTCIRDDGTSTWTKLHPGIEDHDLAHYAVEMELGFTKAFYGMIHQGFEVGDFGLPREQRPAALIPANMAPEAQQTELIVNLLQTEYWNTGQYPNFLETLREMHEDKQVPFPEELTKDRVEMIREKYHALVAQWRKLSPNDILELEFVQAA